MIKAYNRIFALNLNLLGSVKSASKSIGVWSKLAHVPYSIQLYDQARTVAFIQRSLVGKKAPLNIQVLFPVSTPPLTVVDKHSVNTGSDNTRKYAKRLNASISSHRITDFWKTPVSIIHSQDNE